jgi:hypothetical protein
MQKFDKGRHFHAAKGALRSKSSVTTSPDLRSPRRQIPIASPGDHPREVQVDHRTYGVRLASGKTIRQILTVYTCTITGVVLHYALDNSLEGPAAAGDLFDFILIGSRPGRGRKSPR